MKVVQNHLKREKNSKFFFPYFSVITEKNLEKGSGNSYSCGLLKRMCFARAMMIFVLQGGEDGRGTDGGGGRAKSRTARPKLIIKSCVNLHMNSNIHHEFPAPLAMKYVHLWKLI